jgi:hypothetical protein
MKSAGSDHIEKQRVPPLRRPPAAETARDVYDEDRELEAMLRDLKLLYGDIDVRDFPDPPGSWERQEIGAWVCVALLGILIVVSLYALWLQANA